MEDLESDDEESRARAAMKLGIVGPQAVQAVPALVCARADHSAQVTSAAQEALKKIGVVSIPSLLGILRDDQEEDEIRAYAADALADLGPPAMPYLLAAMDERDLTVQMIAIDSFPRVGPAAQAGVMKLGDFLKHESLAYSAAIALGQIAAFSNRPEEALALKLLLAAQKSKDSYLRQCVISAYECMDERLLHLLQPAIKEAAEDPDDEVRRKATWLLKKLTEGR
jgi:HEAT repeat protein